MLWVVILLGLVGFSSHWLSFKQLQFSDWQLEQKSSHSSSPSSTLSWVGRLCSHHSSTTVSWPCATRPDEITTLEQCSMNSAFNWITWQIHQNVLSLCQISFGKELTLWVASLLLSHHPPIKSNPTTHNTITTYITYATPTSDPDLRHARTRVLRVLTFTFRSKLSQLIVPNYQYCICGRLNIQFQNFFGVVIDDCELSCFYLIIQGGS